MFIMGKKSKDKGKRGEREAAKVLSALLGVDISRGVQFQGGNDSPDLKGLKEFGLHPEVKRDESTISLALYKALRQAKSDSGGQAVPFVMSRRNSQKWIISIESEYLVDFCKGIIEATICEK